MPCQPERSYLDRRTMLMAKHWKVPYVFKGATIVHDTASWTGGERLAELLHGRPLSFRIGKRQSALFGDRVQFEKDCSHIQSTVQDFLSWANDEGSLPDAHPLKAYSNQEHFAYADYMHLPELLDNDQDPLMRIIDWSDMGLTDRCGKHSTLWIGSQGAHTPCHYDTYGINFVAQLVGRKRWLLFPPTSPLGQLQTRIPYEESSVYIDIEPALMNRFQGMDVFDVTLQSGDVLFVPKHWWHFVVSLDPLTISVNTWLEQPDDHVERIKEMLVRQIITSTMVAHDCASNEWLNHNEIVTDPSTNLTVLSSLLADATSDETHEPASKRARSDSSDIHVVSHVHGEPVTASVFGHLGLTQSTHSPSDDLPENDLLLKRLLNAMTANETIDLIYQRLLLTREAE